MQTCGKECCGRRSMERRLTKEEAEVTSLADPSKVISEEKICLNFNGIKCISKKETLKPLVYIRIMVSCHPMRTPICPWISPHVHFSVCGTNHGGLCKCPDIHLTIKKETRGPSLFSLSSQPQSHTCIQPKATTCMVPPLLSLLPTRQIGIIRE